MLAQDPLNSEEDQAIFALKDQLESELRFVQLPREQLHQAKNAQRIPDYTYATALASD